MEDLCARLDERTRVRDGQRATVAELATGEPLRPAPVVVFPAELVEQRTVSPQALVAFRGNSYSVPPGLAGARVTVQHRLGADILRIATVAGAVVAAHRRAPDGAGRVVRDDGHVVALERAALTSFSDARPCSHKIRRPISKAALAEAARLRGLDATGPAAHVVIDLSTYAATAARLNTTPTPESTED
ncbi:Mu transposase domain-containing protein [Saccharopolyspora shandongensis]|uniref:Mu transposase domain-containing protein n=1 Tax=Saccharopolyspora shandongensis TaxID=418495 RepID=UPI0033CBF80F